MIERRAAARGVRRLYPLDRRRDRRPLLAVVALTLALLAVRLASLVVVWEPGYTDAYYYAAVASRVAHGQGLTADFVWSFVEAPHFAALPVASHRFWMPLATLVQAVGVKLLGGVLPDFRAGQLAIVAVAALIPPVTYLAARRLGAERPTALLAGAIAGLGGALAPGWVSADAFAPAAVIGTLFFLAFARALSGSARWGAAAGILVGLLYLARAEGALFGLALVWLAGRPRTRRAGAAGLAVALAFGLGWLVRNETLGFPDDLLARSLLLVRYEDFFAVAAPTFDAFASAPAAVIAAKASALVADLVTAAMALLLVLVVPLAVAARCRWRRAEVRAFAYLALVVYLAESLVFTLHAVRGSYFHSLAAFFPFAVALAAVGAQDLFAGWERPAFRVAAAGALVAFAGVSVFALAQWDADFNSVYRLRAAAAADLPPGGVVAIDAAAWAWITGREAVVAPADGEYEASCAADVYLAPTLILEPAHFSAYDRLYGSDSSVYFTARGRDGGIRFYAVREDKRCIMAARP
ncbi:MAG: hypothetical protein KGN00_03665 [Chloroflexota bacterium]|nr:hypothetical protein [Chloroflexota bacterium]MDE3192766.1 hypothetical protein [Chloroflexota bacterium]